MAILLIGVLAKSSKLRLLLPAPQEIEDETAVTQTLPACFLPSEAHSKNKQASEVLSSDGAGTEMDDTLPAREGHVQTLPDSQLPLY